MSTFSSVAGIGAALATRRNRNKLLKSIAHANEANREIEQVGYLDCDDIVGVIPARATMIVSGNNRSARNGLIVARCRRCGTQSLPTVVLHEGNADLEQALGALGSHVKIVNGANPFYEPLYRLSRAEDCARLVVDAAAHHYPIGPEGGMYIRALALIMQRRSLRPSVRMLACCPHDRVQGIIADIEASGRLSAAEALALRNDATINPPALGAIRLFLDELVSEVDILSQRMHLPHSVSVSDCVSAGGMLVIDVTSFSQTALVSILAADMEQCARRGTDFHVVVDGSSIAANASLINLLDNGSSCFWTLSSPDIQGLLGPDEDVERWFAKSSLSVLFSHNARTSESISKTLGEYDKIELTQSCGSSNSIGQFGYHFGSNDGTSVSSIRERIVRPEYVRSMQQGSFLLIGNEMRTVCEGALA